MEKYRKIKVIGKGSFGHAVLVQSVNDRKYYVMKVESFGASDNFRLLMFQKWTRSKKKTHSMR